MRTWSLFAFVTSLVACTTEASAPPANAGADLTSLPRAAPSAGEPCGTTSACAAGLRCHPFDDELVQADGECRIPAGGACSVIANQTHCDVGLVCNFDRASDPHAEHGTCG